MKGIAAIKSFSRSSALKRASLRKLSVSSPIASPMEELDFIETEAALRVVPGGAVGKKAVANMPLKKGMLINEFAAPVFNGPTMHTVQLTEDIHIPPTRGAEFISHACENTNTRIIIDSDDLVGRFVVTEDVEEGEDLFFNYNTTEWDMNSPFECLCESCKAGKSRYIRGFKHLSLKDQENIMHETSPLIRAKAMDHCLNHLQHLYLFEKEGRYFEVESN
mmetsp:Transcript_10342/g.12454  ORF Transcript_10342/g.12454 Transcript_10342/m.12454 type:complete len:220 (-) Transcript_10342:1635-2294(-)